jgi:Putative adhesin
MPVQRNRRHSWRLASPLLALALSLLGGAACGLDLDSGVEARDEWKRSYTLEQGGSLEIKNTNGRINIVSVDGNNVDVKAVRIVKAATDEAAKDALKQFEITEKASPKSVVIDGSSRDGFTIRLQRRVDFEVRVPRWADVRLDSTNGDIEVSGLRGAFRAETTNGRIVGSALEGGAAIETTNGLVTLDFAKLGASGVSCETTNGAIRVTVPRDVSAHISARVTNGDIDASDLKLAVTEQSRRRLDASVGGGGPSIRLETTNGSIAIKGR